MRVVFSSLAVALIASGCDCRGNSGVGQSLAELGVVWHDTDGFERISRDAVYDFGAVFVGARATEAMIIRNLGRGELKLVALEQLDGESVSIGDDGKTRAYFEVKLTPVVALEASGERAVEIAFTPRIGVRNPLARLLLTAEGTRPEDSSATITLKGQSEGGLCDLPGVLDFGEVPLDEHFKLAVVLKNTTSLESAAVIGDIVGPDASSFSSDLHGEHPVPPMSQRVVEITFSPTQLRAYEATLRVKSPGECTPIDIVLKGRGAKDVLTWTPPSIDFGYVSLDVSAPREVTFLNRSNVPLALTNVRTDFGDFAYQPPMGETPNTFTVAPGGTSKLQVTCRPSALGARSGTLSFDTPLTGMPRGAVALACSGGGPRIKVTPRPTLNFGRVGHFPGSSSYSVSRAVTVQNVGTRPPNNDPKGNLHLGHVNGGVPGGLPRVEITPSNAATAAGEFEVSLPASYDPSTGLPATVGQNVADLLITLRPKSTGTKAAELTLYSNDPVEPVIKVSVTADVQPLPPCNLQVTPANLNFGLVSPPDHKDLGVTLRNLGVNANETCYLSGIELWAGSHPAFSLVGGSIDEKELQPQQALTLVVRVSPQGTAPTTVQTLTGQLRFNAADPVMPSRTVPLLASLGPLCLAVAPDAYDFGTVKQGCNTAPREFAVYNTCNADVFVTGVAVQAPAGQSAGGPQCPGTASCPEFTLVSTPTIPTGGLRLAPGTTTSFRAKYRPIDLGPDSGAIVVTAIQSGQNVAYLVSLAGTGDTTGLQTDTFVQPLETMADVLLVIDNSGSMGDKQMNLAANFSSFIQYASSTGADWQIGVISTDPPPGTCRPSQFGCWPVLGPDSQPIGQLVGGPGKPKILNRTTPNLQMQFSQKVNLGSTGSVEEWGLEPALRALTPPLITNENAGFLRYDANLAVVVVSDAGDGSPWTYAYYRDRLRNVKGHQRPNMFTFNVIGPFSANPTCTYDGDGDPARYHQLALETSGVEYEICSPDWATKLRDLGKTAFGFRTTFYLSAEPDLTMGRTLDVKIDGASVPAADFTYDAPTLRIDFDPNKTPGPGKTLTISYFRTCL